MKKKYQIELIIAGIEFVVILLGLFYYLNLTTAFTFLLIISTIMGIPYYHYLKVYLKIKDTFYSDQNLVQALTKTIADCDTFFKTYQNNTLRYIQIPVALIIGVTIGLFISSGDKDFIETVLNLKTKSIIKIIVLIVIGSGIVIPLAIYTFKRRFGKNYDELKQCLKEFEDTQNTSN